MAHKTFISYKHSEAQDLRDCIIRRLGRDAVYYRGEISDSPDLPDFRTGTIRRNLADMIYDTSVMVVIVSPQMLKSRWMEWEIKCALQNQSRDGRASHVNGIVCVVQKDYRYNSFDPYSWAKYCGDWASWKLFDIIRHNRNNKSIWNPNLSSHYIDIVTEDEFLKQPLKYIDDAYNKSQKLSYYEIAK
ncbi:MAG: TIR domain-containing protein [Clostridia bacterium]|nr:TIR domain-containing protein [Clostridia bacterium]